MGVRGGDDVGVAVAVDVEGVHFGAGVGELEVMLLPDRIAVEIFGLFPPSGRFEKIEPPVAVDIADAQAMGEALIAAVLGRDAVEDPGLGRIGRIGCRVAEFALVNADEHRLVADEFGQHRGFIVDGVENEMLFPLARFALRIFVPVGLSAGEADGHDVKVAVVVEIADVFEEGIGVNQRIERLHGFEGVLERELGSVVDERPGDDVHLAVVVEVAVVGAFGVELGGEPALVEARGGFAETDDGMNHR